LDIEQERVDEYNLLASDRACSKWLQDHTNCVPSNDRISNDRIQMTMHGRGVINNARFPHNITMCNIRLPGVSFEDSNKDIENDPTLVVRNRHFSSTGLKKKTKKKQIKSNKGKHIKISEQNGTTQRKSELKEAGIVRKEARDNKALVRIPDHVEEELIIHVNMVQDEDQSQRSIRLENRREKAAELLEAQRLARETRKLIAAKLERERINKIQSPMNETLITDPNTDKEDEKLDGKQEEIQNNESEDNILLQRNEPMSSAIVGDDELVSAELEEDREDPNETEEKDEWKLVKPSHNHWSLEIINEYVRMYLPLEGRMYLHPRNRRPYEVTVIFFNRNEKTVNAYARVTDGAAPEPSDIYPLRVQGKGGIKELVETFEKTGGSLGKSTTPWPMSADQWAKAQEEDPEWNSLIEEMKEELNDLVEKGATTNTNTATLEVTRRVGERTFVYDGNLRLKTTSSADNWHILVIPDQLKRSCMELHHESKGHAGIERTRQTILLRYWWKTMNRDLHEHIKACIPCARRKSLNNRPKVPIQEYTGPQIPWERAHVDLTGPLQLTRSGNSYILVVKDALTRYVETVALKNKTEEEVAKAMIKGILLRHGGFGKLISDNGKEFANQRWAEVMRLLRIPHGFCTPYNPRANGLAENHMKTMKDALSIYCNNTQEDWDDHLPGVTMSYNTTVNSQTGHTPYFMMYGREARLPSDMWMKNYRTISGTLDYVDKLVEALTTVWEIECDKKPVEVKKMRDGIQPLRHLKFVCYQKGDYVMLSMKPKGQIWDWATEQKVKIKAKLQPRYSGPYVVDECLSPVVYKIRIEGMIRKVHAVNMKPFSGRRLVTVPFAETGLEPHETPEDPPRRTLLRSPDLARNAKEGFRFRKKPLPSQFDTEKRNANTMHQERNIMMQRIMESNPRDSILSAEDTVEFSPIMSSQPPTASLIQDEDEYWSDTDENINVYSEEEEQDDEDKIPNSSSSRN